MSSRANRRAPCRSRSCVPISSIRCSGASDGLPGPGLRKLIAEEPSPGYAERQQRLDALLLHLNRVAATTVGGNRWRRGYARPPLAAARIRRRAAPRPATREIPMMGRRSGARWWISNLMRRARSDFKRPGRAGFDAASLKDPEIVDASSAARPARCCLIHARLTRIPRAACRRSRAGTLLWEQRLSETFAAQFERLYGEGR